MVGDLRQIFSATMLKETIVLVQEYISENKK